MPGGTTNAACPREPELGVDDGRDDVDVGDAAVGGVRLLAADHPLVGGLVVAGAGAHGADVGAGLAARSSQNAATFGSAASPKHCGTHSTIWSGVPEP